MTEISRASGAFDPLNNILFFFLFGGPGKCIGKYLHGWYGIEHFHSLAFLKFLQAHRHTDTCDTSRPTNQQTFNLLPCTLTGKPWKIRFPGKDHQKFGGCSSQLSLYLPQFFPTRFTSIFQSAFRRSCCNRILQVTGIFNSEQEVHS